MTLPETVKSYNSVLFPEQKGFSGRGGWGRNWHLHNCSALACRGVNLHPTQRATGSGHVPERILLQAFEDLDLKDSSSGKEANCLVRKETRKLGQGSDEMSIHHSPGGLAPITF